MQDGFFVGGGSGTHTYLQTEAAVLRLPAAPPFRYVRVVTTDRFALEYLELEVKTFELGPDVVRAHVRQRYLAHVHVAVVARQRAVCVDVLERFLSGKTPPKGHKWMNIVLRGLFTFKGFPE